MKRGMNERQDKREDMFCIHKGTRDGTRGEMRHGRGNILAERADTVKSKMNSLFLCSQNVMEK